METAAVLRQITGRWEKLEAVSAKYVAVTLVGVLMRNCPYI